MSAVEAMRKSDNECLLVVLSAFGTLAPSSWVLMAYVAAFGTYGS